MKVIILITILFIAFSSGLVIKDWNPINDIALESADDSIIDFIEDKQKENCELNKVSTKDCPTYSADTCIKDSWFIE